MPGFSFKYFLLQSQDYVESIFDSSYPKVLFYFFFSYFFQVLFIFSALFSFTLFILCASSFIFYFSKRLGLLSLQTDILSVFVA